MVDDRDEIIERVAEALRPLPDVDAAAKARLLVAVAAERERDRESALRRAGRVRMLRGLVGGAGVAAAAAITTLWVRDARSVRPGAVTSTSVAPVASTVPGGPAAAGQFAATSEDAAASALRPVELVLRAPTAKRVRVVGDFNGWDGARAPLVRDAASGLWSVTLALRPGRHVYAFIVDDTLWMRDPRMPAAPDADFGRPGSVMLVGKP